MSLLAASFVLACSTGDRGRVPLEVAGLEQWPAALPVVRGAWLPSDAAGNPLERTGGSSGLSPGPRVGVGGFGGRPDQWFAFLSDEGGIPVVRAAGQRGLGGGSATAYLIGDPAGEAWVALRDDGWFEVIPLGPHDDLPIPLVHEDALRAGTWDFRAGGAVELGIERLPLSLEVTEDRREVRVDLPVDHARLSFLPGARRSPEPGLALTLSRGSERLELLGRVTGTTDDGGFDVTWVVPPGDLGDAEDARALLRGGGARRSRQTFEVEGPGATLVWEGGVWTFTRGGERLDVDRSLRRDASESRTVFEIEDGSELELIVRPNWRFGPPFDPPAGNINSRVASLWEGFALWRLADQAPVTCLHEGVPCRVVPKSWTPAGAP